MRNFLLFCFCLVATIHLNAQTYTPVKSEATVVKKIKDKSKNLKSISADFTETVSSSVIANPESNKGKIYYQATDKIRWEKNTGTKEVIIIKGSEIGYYKGGKKVENAGSKKMVKRVQSLMMNVITSKFVDEKEFSIKYKENTSKYKLVLIPKKAGISRYVSHIELFLDKKDMSLKEFIIYESEADYVSYKFSSAKYNNSLSKELFEKP